MNEAKPKRRWFRFSLRTLLVFLTLFGIWIGWQVDTARKQKRAVAAVLKAGGHVCYDYQYRPGIRFPSGPVDIGLAPAYAADRNANPPGPAWLRKQVGEDYFQTVVGVFFSQPNDTLQRSDLEELANLPRLTRFLLQGTDFRDEDLNALRALGDLKVLQLIRTPINGSVLALLPNPEKLKNVILDDNELDDTAMVSVGKMTNLLQLSLRNTRITDAGLENVRNLANLETLDLRGTNVGDAGLLHIRQLRKLIILSLQSTNVTDAGLRHLNEMRALRILNIIGTNATVEGVHELQMALPNLSINVTKTSSTP